jgi:hypothetical protein
MKVSNVEETIKKIEEVRKEVEDYIKKEIKEEDLLQEFLKFNNELALFLVNHIEKYGKNLDSIHIYKPKSIEEYYEIIKEKIILGSHLEIVRNEANKIREKIADEWDTDKIYFPKDFNEYKNNSWKYILVAKEIEKYIRSKIKYVSEPDDIIYSAQKILEQGYGDCDDFAVILSSFFRSLNFKVGIGFLNNHVYSSVILPTAEVYEDKEEIRIRFVIVPADNIRFKLSSFEEELTIYDLLNFFSKVREKIVKLVLQGDKRIVKELNEIKENLKYYSEAKFFPIDPLEYNEIKELMNLDDLMNKILDDINLIIQYNER